MSLPITEIAVGDTTAPTKKNLKLCFVLLYSTAAATGTIGGPLLQRLYYTHGGSSKWISSLLVSIGCIGLLPLLLFLYFKTFLLRKLTPKVIFFMGPNTMLSSAALGLLAGLFNYLYSAGMSSIPVSTSTLLLSTQLAFTALFARVIVRQKITFYSLNAVTVIVLGAVVLALHTSDDRPQGETRKKYFLGFFLTLLGASLQGLIFPLIELAYSKSKNPMNYMMVLQFQFVMNIFASLFAIAGMLISKDYKIISKEAEEFGLGVNIYCVIIVASAILWQLSSVGAIGIISCTSSLFAGILCSVLVPMTEIGSIVTFGERFSAEKGLSLALCLWGFISYFVGEYKMSRKKKFTDEPCMQLR